jgi:hypothetical protein
MWYVVKWIRMIAIVLFLKKKNVRLMPLYMLLIMQSVGVSLRVDIRMRVMNVLHRLSREDCHSHFPYYGAGRHKYLPVEFD